MVEFRVRVMVNPSLFPTKTCTDLSFTHFRSQYWRLQTELGAE